MGLERAFPAASGTAQPFDHVAWEQKKADGYNKEPGKLHEKDGYNCPTCKNKGDVMVVEVLDNWPRPRIIPCKCMPVRASIARMEQSGLGKVIREKTFEKYQTHGEAWRETIKAGAMEYAANPSGWLVLCGQPGCGKTHLGTAACRELLLRGQAVTYMVWPGQAAIIKGCSKNEPERREKLVRTLKAAPVLYIDDLFKPARTSGAKQPPTEADVKLAFEILNHRYNDPRLLTIISSEWFSGELLEIDPATGSRIIEMAGLNLYDIAEDESRNYRLRKAVTV